MNNRIYQSPDVYTVLSNRLVSCPACSRYRLIPNTHYQLTSLSSLQSSLDLLRTHRPDYTPRTGFVWPILDPTIQDENTKKKAAEEETNAIADEGTSELKRKVLNEAPRRQQNNMLLLNAMRATAAHSKMSLPSSAFTGSTENLVADTPAPHIRSSATPAPTPSQGATPKNTTNPPTVQEPTKAPPGAGKKKRKRLLPYPHRNNKKLNIMTGTLVPAPSGPS